MKVKKFYADWCEPCKLLSKILDNIKIDIPVEEVNIDQNMDSLKQYNVRSVPTMIMFDENDREIKRKVGIMTNEEAVNWFRN